MARRLGRPRDADRLRRRDERVRGPERGFTVRRGPEPGVVGPAGALGVGTAQTRRVYHLFCGGRATKLAYAPRGWCMALRTLFLPPVPPVIATCNPLYIYTPIGE